MNLIRLFLLDDTGGNHMRIWKIGSISLFILILLATSACSPVSGQNPSSQQVSIARGDIIVKVNGSGKTLYANDAKLNFGTAGRIEKLAVKKGDRVTRGTEIAKLDTANLELSLSQAQTAEAQAKVTLAQSVLAQTQAETALTSAQMDLDKIKEVSDYKNRILDLEWTIKIAKVNLRQAAATNDANNANYLNRYIAETNSQLAKEQKKLADLLAKDAYQGTATYIDTSAIYDVNGKQIDRLTVEDIRLKEQRIESAQQNIDQAKLTVSQSQRALEQAQKTIGYTQKQIKESTIVAPFDGVIATMDAKEGDYVAAPGTYLGTLIYMVDTNSLEVSTEIDEIDIANVSLNQKTLVRLDALPVTQFEGNVTAISVTPKEKPQNAGVVVYEVKIGFAGTPPTQAKSGMSATVDVVTNVKKDVLLVPNKSIKKNNQGQTTVNVIVNQKPEERKVVLGLSDGTQTEVINGLNEGDLVSRPLKETNSKLS
jgi:HlyD family secretion protein